MPLQPQLAFINVTGIDDAVALAKKLLEMFSFNQVKPLLAGQYVFSVKAHRESLPHDVSSTTNRTYEDADFSIMDLAGLAAWYEQNVGYDPVEDDPSTDLEELRALCTELLEIDRAGGLD